MAWSGVRRKYWGSKMSLRIYFFRRLMTVNREIGRDSKVKG